MAGRVCAYSILRVLVLVAFYSLKYTAHASECRSEFISYRGYAMAFFDETLVSPSDTACTARCYFKNCASNSCQFATFRRDTSECFLSNGTVGDMRYFANANYKTMVTVSQAPQIPYSMGDHYTGFMKNYLDYTPQILIVTTVSTLVSLSVPSLGIQDTFIVDGTAVRSFDYGLAHTSQGEGGAKGVHISASNPVEVYQLDNRTTSLGMSLVLPSYRLGRHYITMQSPNTVKSNMFLIVATQNSTEVSIIMDGVNTENITLNRLETYFKSGTDVTSTIIEADADIVVLSGAPCSKIPDDQNYCDNVYETMPPTISFGTIFIVAYMYPRPDFTVGILGKEDQTNVTITDVEGQTIETLILNRAETVYREYLGAQTISIISTKGVLVSQFGHGDGSATVDPFGDPSMMLIAPLDRIKPWYTVMIPPGNDLNVIEIVVRNETDIRINGSPVLFEHAFSVSLSSGLTRVAYAYNTTGAYHLTHVYLEPFAVYLYGGNRLGEYATCAGWFI